MNNESDDCPHIRALLTAWQLNKEYDIKSQPTF